MDATAIWGRSSTRVTSRRASGPRSSSASLAGYLHLRTPERDTVLYPGDELPDLRHGSDAGRAAPGAGGAGRDGRLDLASIDPTTPTRALVLWANSPSNPTGSSMTSSTSRRGGDATACRSRVTSATPSSPGPAAHAIDPRARPERRARAALHLEALEPRRHCAPASTRATTSWSPTCAVVRQHAGLMVPGPVQAAVALAYGDDEHVARAARALPARLELMSRSAQRIERRRAAARRLVLPVVLEGGPRRLVARHACSPSASGLVVEPGRALRRRRERLRAPRRRPARRSTRTRGCHVSKLSRARKYA